MATYSSILAWRIKGAEEPAGPSPWVTQSQTQLVTNTQGSPGGAVVKKKTYLPIQELHETQFPSLGWEDPLEEEMVTHSSVLAWRILMDRGAWQAPVHRVTQGRTPLSSHSLNSLGG